MDNNYNASDTTTEYRFAGFRLDVRRKKLFNADGALVTLSARPFDALLALVARRGDIVTREELMEAVWPGVFVEENNLSQAISTVRKALNDTTSESHFIRTVPGRGYSFTASVEAVPAATAPGHEAVDSALPPTSAPDRAWRRFAPALLALVLGLGIGVFALEPWAPIAPVEASASSAPSPFGVSAIPRPESLIPNSIAVLPLVTLGQDGDAFFAAGLHDEIINQLTQTEGLNVVARSSVVALLGQGLTTLDLARVLRVESILSGTIRLAGSQARVGLQLVDVRTGITVWSEAYDVDQRDPDGVLSTQGDIALTVASALRTEIPQTEHSDFAGMSPELANAHRYNLAARRAHHYQNYAAEWHLARKALELYPDFYDALYRFASANAVLMANPLPGMTSREHAQLTLVHADRMLELAPASSEAYALKISALAADGNWAEARTAIAALDGMDAPQSSREYAAHAWMALGDFPRALAIYNANLDAVLVNPHARASMLVALELAGRREESRQQYALGEELHSQWRGDAVNILLALGRDEPLHDVEEVVGISAELKQVLLHYEDTQATRSALASYAGQPAKRPREALYYAALAAELGEHDLAVELLRASVEGVRSNVFWTWLPVFDETRRHAGFRELLDESGLVGYWQLHGWPEVCEPAGAGFRCDWSAY